MSDDFINSEDYNLKSDEFDANRSNYGWSDYVDRPKESLETNDNKVGEDAWDSERVEERLVDNDMFFLNAPRKKPTNWWLVITTIIGAYFIFSILIFDIFLTPLQVVGASMYPTLNYDDSEETCDVVYIKENSKLSVGDIVVMDAKNYVNIESYYIKRIVAVGGDRVQFVRADNNLYADSSGSPCGLFYLYVNGEKVIEDYINDETPLSEGTMYLRLDVAELNYFETICEGKEITVPEGEVYLLGDNRRVSNDSKYFGCVKEEDILGRVVIHRAYGENLAVSIYNSMKKYIFN